MMKERESCRLFKHDGTLIGIGVLRYDDDGFWCLKACGECVLHFLESEVEREDEDDIYLKEGVVS